MVILKKHMKNISVFFQSTFFYLLIIGYFFLSLVQLENYDIWWHLKTGEWIIDNLIVPHTQLFSYSIGSALWIDHSWLFQVLVFLIYKFLGGINSLIFFRACMIGFILWITLKSFFKKVYFPVFLLVGWLFFRLFLDRAFIRPELVSAFFLSAYLYILFNKKNPWILVLIQFFWVNMHGYSMLGPILLSLFIISEFIKDKTKLPFEWNRVKYLDDKVAYNKGLLVLAVTFFLLFLTPYGIGSLRYPFFAIKSFLDTTNNFYRVSELSSLPLSDILFTQKDILLTSVITLFMASLLWNIRRINLFNVLIFVIFFVMCSAANRHRGFFAVVSCFCILDNFKAGGGGQSLMNYFKTRYIRILSISITVLVSLFIVWYQFSKAMESQKRYIYSKDLSSKDYMYGINRNRYPEEAVDFILKNNIKGPIFNGFNIGGYLIWRLYPSYKVFVDGRTEVYGKEFMDEFVASVIDFERWKRLDEKYEFNMVILDYSSADFYYHIIKNLYESERWRLVYFGDVAVIFLKDNLINRQIVSSHEILFDNMQDDIRRDYDGQALTYPEYFLNRARFFINAMDMPEESLRNLETAELINPECYEVYQLRGYTYFKMKKFNEAQEAFLRSLQIDPNIAEPYLNLGSVAAEMGLYKRAYFLYKQALFLDKDNRVARENLNRLP